MKTITTMTALTALFMTSCISHSTKTNHSTCNVSETVVDAGVIETSDGGSSTTFSSSHPIGVGYLDVPTPFQSDHIAYLTFDDGPSDWTNDFLAILQAHLPPKSSVTFFITSRQFKVPPPGDTNGLDGSYIDNTVTPPVTYIYRDLLKQEIDSGYAIGNHTVTHPDLGTLTSAEIETELNDNELNINEALLKSGGQPIVLSLFRPPYGSPWYGPSNDAWITPTVTLQDWFQYEGTAGPVIANHGVNVMWTLDSTDSADWAMPDSTHPVGESFSRTLLPTASSISTTVTYSAKVPREVDAILNSPQVLAGQSFISLMHDTHDCTRDALGTIIDGLVAAGYTFQNVEQYVQGRWSRPSIEMTPGPNMYSSSVAENNWGCQEYTGTEVCGRMWEAYQSVCGPTDLLLPTVNQTQSSTTNIVSQSFQNGVLSLHPENATPDNVEIN